MFIKPFSFDDIPAHCELTRKYQAKLASLPLSPSEPGMKRRRDFYALLLFKVAQREGCTDKINIVAGLVVDDEV